MLENDLVAVAVDTVPQLPRMWVPPGVYPPQEDSLLIAKALADVPITPESKVLDYCTGSGVLAATAATMGATDVVAVDISRLAAATAWLNVRRRRLPVKVLRGDLATAATLGPFDVVISNPPYVPAAVAAQAAPYAQRWDAGHDGRAVLDPLCASAFDLVRPGGCLLVVHSEYSNENETVRMLAATGFEAAVVARSRIPFGPVLRDRRTYLSALGLCGPDCDEEELVVIRADRPENR